MAPLIESVNLTVDFGVQRALDRVSFSLRSGEIVGLVGANGAGKSTFGRVLVGEIPCGNFSGELKLKGREARFFDAKHAHKSGVTLIHQEGTAIDELSVGENVMLTIEPARKGVIDWEALHAAATDGLRQLGTVADTRRLFGEHGGVALMELVEIARSIVRGGSVFVFDESTAALGSEEIASLVRRMRELSARGAGIIFISHRIDEVLAVCDRVVVLRDGRKVLDVPRTAQDHASVIRAMLGERSEVARSTPIARPVKVSDSASPAAFMVRNWHIWKSEFSRVEVGPLNFDARRGEILGVFGPLGAGKTELLHSLYGLSGGLCTGEYWLEGVWTRPFRTPVAAIRQGMALVPAERQREGVVTGLSVLDNMMLGYRRPGLTWRGTVVRYSELRSLCERLIAALGIVTTGPDQPIERLSGGNQQKVLLARAMVNSPTILLLDEPTRGIDVGAKQDVYRWIRETAAGGAVIVMSSLEEEELIGLADRILVLRDGRNVAILDARDASAKGLLLLTAGGPSH
jgi:ABC-type sugar transport system ATPase subunit